MVGATLTPVEKGFAANALSTFDTGYCTGEEFGFTGADQILTPTAGATHMKVKVWGAGGGRDGASKGGAGGYVEAEVPIIAGTAYTAVVGEKGTLGSSSYGFAGIPHTASAFGGGLSGLFTGAAVVTDTDQDRAILIAGGGGSGEQTAGQGIKVHNGGMGGNPTLSGGQPSMKGQDGYNDNGTAVPSSGGSGGGYEGGTAHKRGTAADSTGPTENYGGGGGSNYINPALVTMGTDQSLFTAEWTSPPAPPNKTDTHYSTPVGPGDTGHGSAAGGTALSGGHGLVVVQYSCVSPAPEWSITGTASVNEGSCASYTVSMTSPFDNTATVDLASVDATTSAADYDNLNTAVTAAVAAYTGPGTLSWNGTALSFDGGGTVKMADLTFSLCATTDATQEGTEAYDVKLSNPKVLSCVMPEMLARARINGGNSATSMNHIDNLVTNFGTNGISSTWTDQGTAVYSLSGGVLTNTTGENSQFTYSDNTLPANEDGFIQFNLSTPLPALTQLDVGFGNSTYPVSDVFIVDINSAAGWRTNGTMPGFVGVADGNDPTGSTAWQPGIAAADLYRVSREGCDMKWYRNGTEIRNLTRKSTILSAGAVASGANSVTTNITEPLDTDADGIADPNDLDDDNDGIPDLVESPPLLSKPFKVIDHFPGFTAGDFIDLGPVDVSSMWSLPAGSVIVEIRDASINSGGTIVAEDETDPANGVGEMLLTGTVPVEVRMTHGRGLPVGDYDGVEAFDGAAVTFTGNIDPDLVHSTIGNRHQIDLASGASYPANGTNQVFEWRTMSQHIGWFSSSAASVVIFSLTPMPNIDTDTDGIPDRLDLDSDNDGISDLYESGDVAGVASDVNADGTVALAEDTDTDNDGLMDIFEDGNLTTDLGTVPVDSDGDTVNDVLDLDSDADGIADTIEARPTAAFVTNDGDVSNDDTDGDGVIDIFDSNSVFGGGHTNFNLPVNTDGDTFPDYLDSDSDNDGDSDSVEGGSAVGQAPGYIDPDGSVNNPLSATDGELLDNNDADATEVDYRSDEYAPVTTADSGSTAADTNATVALADNITDVNGNQDLATIDLDPSTPGVDSMLTTADGIWSVDAAGVVTFDPVPAFEGTASISYVVSDDDGNVSAPASVSVTVSGAIPVATNDATTTGPDTNVSLSLADNVSDPNNDVDITTIDLDPTTPAIDSTITKYAGVWSVDSAGMVTFDPAPGIEGTATISYVVSDDDGNVSAPADVSVVVAGATPVATADSANTAADTNATVALADNVSDANNDVVITTIDLDPSTPGVDITITTTDGVWSVDPAGVVTFDPVAAFEGTASIPYVVSDDDGNVSAPANVSVTVGGATPVATADSANTAADTNATVALADNVTDANNDADITTIDLDPSTPGVDSTLTTADGVWSVDPTGVVTFDPASAFEGTATISYVVSDDDGNVSAPANVSVTVAGATPVATADSAATAADTNAMVALADNVTDANNDADITTIDLDPSTPGVDSTITTADGIWSVDPTGVVTFDPVSAFEGTATIPYVVSDDDGNVSTPANVSVTVAGATPVATADSAATAADTNATVALADNVTDANNDADITTIDLDPSTPGVDSTLTTTDGIWSVDPTGVVTFDPVSAFEGTASIPYVVSDDDGNVSAPASISVTVNGAIPVATNDAATTGADTNITISLADNVSDANNDVDISTIDLDPSTPGIDSTLTIFAGVWSVDATGQVTFDPAPGIEGTVTIPYVVSDDDGNVSAPATVLVVVAGAIPVATADSATTAPDTNATVALADNVSDANNDVVITTIDLVPSTPGVDGTFTTADGVWSVDAAGVVTFDPVPGFEGTATIQYVVSDDDGNVSAPANVSVTVAGAIPVATADSATVAADSNATVALADNVSDANNDVDITTIDLDPSTPGVDSTLATADGIWSVDAAGVVTFDPVSSFEGTATIPYVVSDDDGNVSAPANISVTVAGATPVVTADSTTTTADTIATVALADNVSDANNDADITTIDLDPSTPGIDSTLTTADGVWSVDAAGVVTFDPVSSFEGTATIAYVVSDDDANVSASADVSVIVAGAGPVVTPDSTTVAADTTATVDVSDNATDANNDVALNTVDLDPATPGIQNTLTTADGVWSVTAAGIVSFDPDPAFEGSAVIAYTVSDDDGNVAVPSTVSVNVGGATPIATNDAAAVLAGGNATVDLSDNISDANNDEQITSIDLDPSTPGIQNTLTTADGVWSVDPAGMLSFIPVAGFQGAATVDYTVSDDDGNVSIPATVTVTVGTATPIADADMAITVQNIDVVIDVLDGDVDANNDIDPSTIDLDPATPGIQSSITVAGEGTYSVAGGQVMFDPDPAFSGTSALDYTVSDLSGNVSNVAMATVDVQLDTDGDGIADINDLDDDNDGIPDLMEGAGDTDADGIPDSLDLDSDNDGLTDTSEAGGNDVDGNGVIDGFVDADGDGADDATTATPLPVTDTDGDGNADYVDVDSDNDGMTDTAEAGGTDTDGDGQADGLVDTNGDGLDDTIAATPLPNADSDNDGVTDHLDIDSDNDGITDATEAGSVDADGDGEVDGFTDADGDGLDDGAAAAGLNGGVDTDNDGLANHLDLDSDNDGLTDAVEAGGTDADGDGIVDTFTDSDANGMDDGIDTLPLPVADTDNDGIADCLDLDSDNDGLTDTVEAGGTDANSDGMVDNFSDANNDGLDDVTAAAPMPVDDNDADGEPDHLDLDSDNDGIWDLIEAGGAGTDADGVLDNFTDTNGDGLDDSATPLPNADTDGDATPDYLDADSDNDGIPDSVESGGNPAALVDTDANGVADYVQLDSDSDGIPDSVEAGATPSQPVDTDGDGTPDYQESDSDNDGIPDSLESTTDTDGDGTPDYLDADSDNDGIPDSVEAGATPAAPLDTDGDGTPDYLDLDSDTDGIPDNVEAGLTPAIPVDTDGDGSPDYLELDSDNDTIPDAVEAGNNPVIPSDTDSDGTPDYLEPDADNDGIPDSLEAGSNPASPVDTDGDGNADFLESDSDDDGISDAVEAGANPAVPSDTDGDGTPDYLESDSDNDGIPDSVEAGPNPSSPVDTDGDGIPDFLEPDSDNDGIPDSVEAGPNPSSPVDTDGDGTPDFLESDSDNDGIPDSVEAGSNAASPSDTDGDGIPDFLEPDSDSDGIPDSVEAGSSPAAPVDTDGDGIPDFIESDSDNDGIPDSVEAGSNPASPVDTDGDGTPDFIESDSDNDGIPDSVEAGSNSASPADTDGDGVPDFLEQDSDNDGIPDSVEAGANPATPTDTDGDGTPDYLESDSDNDGIPDSIEAGSNPASPVDTDGDGTPDYVESDSDNDGIPDSIEAGANPSAPVDSDSDGIADFLDQDSDADGIPDGIEAGTNPGNPLDTDNDGLPDYLDLDSDSDGVEDNLEAGADPSNPDDLDGNGVPDFQEGGSDSDSDGIPDSIEGTVDTDGDGVPDYLDQDSDADNIDDAVETAVDTDEDSLPDYVDVDADNDGISDALEGDADTDGDGVEDFRDLDVDNDGIFDLIEVRIGQVEVNLIDANNDGMVDPVNPYGFNGMADIVETVADSGLENYVLPDVDGDGVFDFRDLDTDNDGLLDTHESDHPDENYNGLIDSFGSVRRTVLAVDDAGVAPDAGGLPRNTDEDGLADFRDPDSDNDGIMDVVESFGSDLDLNNDGMLDDFADSDGNGVDDDWLTAPDAPADTDGDGIADAVEIDADGDGIADVIESGGVDLDGDGMLDGFTDADGDGIDDTVAAVPGVVVDTDGDGTPDFQDLDSDNDGLSDVIEAGGSDADGDGIADNLVSGAALPDADGDGIPDFQEVAVGTDQVVDQPVDAAPEQGAALPAIRTGLEGSGCAISPALLSKAEDSVKVDPTLPLLSMLAVMGLVIRRRTVAVTKKVGNR